MTRSIAALIFFLLFSFAEAKAQNCMAHAEWTFDPPPVNGMFELNTTVEVCVDLVMYAPGGGSWLSGLELDFPPGWYISTLNVTSMPEGCEPGEGEWVYLDTLDCAPHHFGPGFYFDRNNEGSGMPDGNFCNNYGDECALFPSNMTFCFEMQVAGDCPTDQENLFPYIRLISDDYFGDFPPVCPLPIYIQPDLPGLSLNCCGAGATGPDTVALCESQCLYDLLENAPEGGYWTGPDGYEDVQYCGYFDMNIDIPGDYTYHYEEAMCFLSATITVTDSILDIMPVIPFCGEENRDLHASIYEVAIPQDAIWYNPAGEVVADGIAEASTDGLGIYECHFLSETGCLLILEVNYTGLLVAGVEVSTVICESNELFCLGEVFQLLQPPGIEVTGYGNWIVYDHEDNFLDYIPEWDQCLSYEYLESHGSNELVFVYILGAPPCSSQLTPFNVYLSPGAQIEAIVDTVCIGLVDLASYLPQGLPQEGQWLNGDINISPILLPENYAPNTILNLTYTGNQDSDCPFSIPVSITILESQQNLIESTHNYCGDGSVLDLSDLVPDFIGGGLFSPSQEVVLLPQNAGTYTYSISPTGCIGPLYAFNLTISDSLHYSDLTTTLTEDGTGYTVSLTITGGEPPYLVDGSLLSGDSFTSSILSVGTDYAFTLSDSGLCQDIIITGSFVETCTVSAGESPGEIAHCQAEPFCLFDQLTNADAGGAWYGPPGWTDAGCGLVDPSAHPPGNYFYIVSDGAECSDTAVVTLSPVEFGEVQSIASCTGSEINLYQLAVSEGEGFWMAPGYPQILDTIQNGIVNPDNYASGIYTYVFYDSDGCLTTFGIDLHFGPQYTGNTDIEPATVCADETSFSPAEAIGLYPPQVTDGDWIVWDGTGTILLDYLPEWDVTLTGEYLQNLGSSLVFTYIQGVPPCDPFMIDLPVFVSEGGSEIADSVCQSTGSVNLFIFLPPTAPPGGIWTDQNGAVTIGIIDLSSYEAGSVQIFYYTGFSGSGCLETIELSLTILESPDAGDDYFIDFCGTGEQIDLYTLLPEDVDQSGTFSESPIAAIPANSGPYTYLLSSALCGNDSAVYTLAFTEPLTAAATAVCNTPGITFIATLIINGGVPSYTVNGGGIAGNSFVSSNLTVADGEAIFLIEDQSVCDAIEVTAAVDDTDGDGVCDDQEITGCMNPSAANYNAAATDPGNCMYGIDDLMAHVMTWVDPSEYGKPAADTDHHTGNSPGEALSLFIFPNPATDEISLQINGLSDTDALIEITDILGSVRCREVLASANGTTFMKVDLRSYPSGIYLIRLTHAEKDIVQKIIIAR